DAVALHRVIKRDGAKHISVIGHGARLHTKFLSACRKGFYLNGAVEKTVVSVKVKVCKSAVRHNYGAGSCSLSLIDSGSSLAEPGRTISRATGRRHTMTLLKSNRVKR